MIYLYFLLWFAYFCHTWFLLVSLLENIHQGKRKKNVNSFFYCFQLLYIKMFFITTLSLPNGFKKINFCILSISVLASFIFWHNKMKWVCHFLCWLRIITANGNDFKKNLSKKKKERNKIFRPVKPKNKIWKFRSKNQKDYFFLPKTGRNKDLSFQKHPPKNINSEEISLFEFTTVISKGGVILEQHFRAVV